MYFFQNFVLKCCSSRFNSPLFSAALILRKSSIYHLFFGRRFPAVDLDLDLLTCNVLVASFSSFSMFDSTFAFPVSSPSSSASTTRRLTRITTAVNLRSLARLLDVSPSPLSTSPAHCLAHNPVDGFCVQQT